MTYSSIQSEYYGDNTRWFIGVVEDVADVKQRLGRVRVRIFGIHSPNTADVGLEDLPWAHVAVPITQGGVAGSTQPTGVQKGARVFGIFLDGAHSQTPLVLGVLPHIGGARREVTIPQDQHVPATGNQKAHQVGDPVTTDVREKLIAAGEPEPKLAVGMTQVEVDALNEGVKTAAAPPGMVGSHRQEQAYNFLRTWFMGKNSVDPGVHAAAFVGNFLNESGPNMPPTAGPDYIDTETGKTYSGSHSMWGQENSFGIAQWNKAAGRFATLREFARGKNVSWQDLGLQLEFVTHELETTHRHVLAKIKKASTMEAATAIVLRFYEVPMVAVNYNRYQSNRDSSRQSTRQSAIVRAYIEELEKRTQDARDVHEEFGG